MVGGTLVRVERSNLDKAYRFVVVNRKEEITLTRV